MTDHRADHDHRHDHDHAAPSAPERFDQAFWDDRYRSAPALWSGRPNAQLVAEAADLGPGRALDVGCGEGADAIWLAERGWQVTGVDLSPVALERARGHADLAGERVAARIDWRQVDLLDWPMPRVDYDLISSQYLHLPGAARRQLVGVLAGAVAPGGSLLVVGHHPSDVEVVPRPLQRELFFTAEQLAEGLDPESWEVVTCATVPRPSTGPDGDPVTLHDTVLRARRRPG